MRDWKPWTGRGPVLLIAEIANAHEGRLDDAAALVEAAAAAGCGAVKFQKYFADEMLAPGHSLMETFRKWEWGPSGWTRLMDLARGLGLRVFVDVFGERALRSLSELPPADGLKVHGADASNAPLLDLLARDERPLLLGTGGSSDLDIHRALLRLGRRDRLVLMHGFQAFPTPLEETCLSRLPRLAGAFGTAVGLSDHLDAQSPFARLLPLLAVPLGACCVEKHLTLDRSRKGVDHQSSLNPEEMRELAERLKDAEAALGTPGLPKSALEEGYRKRFKKCLVSARDVPKGRVLSADDLALRMVENPGRHPMAYEEALGRKASRNIPASEPLSGKDTDGRAGLCLIARLKSTRLPRKAFADIHSMTAIQRLFERAKLCRAAEGPVLCTSNLPADAPLLDAAREAGVDFYAGSPEEPIERLIACAERGGWSHVVRATADNIFLDPGLLARAVDLALDQNLDYVSMWTAPVGTHCEVMSLPALRFIQERADAPFTTEYLTWFLVGSPNFRRAELELPPGLRRSWRLTLDTPEDLRNIRDLVALLGPRNHGYCLEDLVAAVESDPLLEARLRTPPVGVPAPPSEVRFDYLKGAR